ncbi:MAG: hypothetical protein H6Q66_790 [Firmicutes bacterium]|nr:hypothetical protein [Bacillota bacterium]
MKVLNFYYDIHNYQLERREKHCSIRLGDKRPKYQDGDIVWITYGIRDEVLKKIYTGAIRRVDYKQIKQLTKEDLVSENPSAPTIEQLLEFLQKIYKKPITVDDYVSVIYFREVIEEMVEE